MATRNYFFCLLLFELEGNFISFFKDKKSQRGLKTNQGFSYYFCLMIEGYGAGAVHRTNGSGSGRPKDIRIRIRITEAEEEFFA